MKIICSTLFALLTLTASAQLQPILVPIPVFPTCTALIQSSIIDDNGKTITVPKATVYSITGKSLLPIIAEDELNAGKYGSSTFLVGSKLVFMADQESFTNSYYVVENKAGEPLVTLTNLMSLAPENGFIVDSYVENNTNGLSNPFIDDYVGVITFNDTGVGGSTAFDLSYLVLATEEAKVTSKENYTETYLISLGAGSGVGSIGGKHALIYSKPIKFTVKSTHPLP